MSLFSFFGWTKQSIEFSYETFTSYLGTMFRPTAKIEVWSPVFKSWEQVQVIVDTGADITLLPNYLAGYLGYDLSKAKKLDTQGVGGEQVLRVIEDVEIKVGPFKRTIPVGFASSNTIPSLLGRHLCLETFTIEFQEKKKVVFRG